MKCPFCKMEIDNNSRKCPICHTQLLTNCPYCHVPIKDDYKFCQACGKRLINNNDLYEAKSKNEINDEKESYTKYTIRQFPTSQNPNIPKYNPNYDIKPITNKLKKKPQVSYILLGASIILVIISLTLLFTSDKVSVYLFKEGAGSINEEKINSSDDNIKTKINYNKTYDNVLLYNETDVNKLIVEDSVEQKKKCENKEISAIENKIVQKYGITAVNLCEIDIEYAKEIEKVIKHIYDKYPKARNFLTNITLTNEENKSSYIAIFMGSRYFASSGKFSYPRGHKMIIGLNSYYFLNSNRLNKTVKNSSLSGYFPKNASVSSVVAHEFGHYLSFLTLLDKYNTDFRLLEEGEYISYYKVVQDWNSCENSKNIINEAYYNYLSKYNEKITVQQFRESISNYAIVKDNEGNYLYDETIAEAFHDFYINGNKAAKASIEIVKVLEAIIEKIGE